MQLKFYGATETVTGSKHLLELENGKNFLLDCGMYQGVKESGTVSNQHFGFNPMEIDVILLSHAHIDHSGLIPLIVKQGFKGTIYCTPATRDLCEVMLLDSAHIQESDISYVNKKNYRKDKKKLEPLFTEKDVLRSLKLFSTVDYHIITTLYDGFNFHFTDAGHILGSAAIHMDYTFNNKLVRLSFTGDIGRQNDKILPKPADFRQADYLICESTYGDRLHGNIEDSLEILEKIVYNTCVINEGNVIIPAFSLGRTQEIVYSLDILKNQKKLPNIKVFVDSPLSAKTTEIMEKHKDLFNPEIKEYMQKSDGNPFFFKDLEYITEVEDSKRLNNLQEPCIIISASGMAEAGRVKHHIKNNISDPNNTILLVGYASPYSLAGRLKNGDKEVTIFGKHLEVKANVEYIDSYSAHADYSEIIDYLKCQQMDKTKKVFLVHGEDDAKIAMKEHFTQFGYNDVEIVDYASSYHLK